MSKPGGRQRRKPLTKRQVRRLAIFLVIVSMIWVALIAWVMWIVNSRTVPPAMSSTFTAAADAMRNSPLSMPAVGMKNGRGE